MLYSKTQEGEEGAWTGSSDEDTIEEELYECKVEVKQQNTMVSWPRKNIFMHMRENIIIQFIG